MNVCGRNAVRLVGLAALVALALAPTAARGGGTAGAPVITYSCTPAPTDCTGWYRRSVTIRWSWSADATNTVGCNTHTLATDTKGSDEWCVAENSSGRTRVDVIVHVDRTPPTMTSPVPERPPDSNGWYNHPVTVAFHGTDATSGLASCTVARYAGPSSGAASVSGTCRDVAGNTSAPQAYALKYDDTPPAVRASASPLNDAVVVRWRVSSDTRLVEVYRKAGTAGSRGIGRRIYRGVRKAVRDSHVRNGTPYLYTVQATSNAGLVGAAKVRAVPTPLFSPAPGAVLDRPPLLAWASVARATYYNVQLRRNGRKILSVWPKRTSLQLRRRWTFQGRRYSLAPGRYRWFVWPGFGAPAQARYGSLLGQSRFAIRR